MARGGKGGDRVLESRHLVGLFLGVVLLCGVFFTLGYVMGKTQFDAVHAASATNSKQPANVVPTPPTKGKGATSAAPGSDPAWDSYDPTKKNNDEHIEPAPKAVPGPAAPTAANSKPTPSPSVTKQAAPPAKQAGKYAPPAMSKSAIVLQVAAVTQQRDALEVADELQRKKFPAFITTPTTDNFYRVQIGPYADMAAAQAAMRALEQAGFKVIIKR
jgi:septal ring-binding cell division protein DamX